MRHLCWVGCDFDRAGSPQVDPNPSVPDENPTSDVRGCWRRLAPEVDSFSQWTSYLNDDIFACSWPGFLEVYRLYSTHQSFGTTSHRRDLHMVVAEIQQILVKSGGRTLITPTPKTAVL